MSLARREYKSGMKWCVWRWKDISWRGKLYLRRLHIFQCPLFTVMLHFIVSRDEQRHLHDHPVSMLCFVLRGWYEEQTKAGVRTVFCVNWIPAVKTHRIITVSDGGVVTLCLAGPRKRQWGFHTEDGWVRWDKYVEKYEEEKDNE